MRDGMMLSEVGENLGGFEPAGFRVFELDTPERKELFEWDHDELLDCITVKEFRDAELDWDEECDFDVRCWYYDNKCPAPEE